MTHSVGIIALLIIKYAINFIEENNTGNATTTLIALLAPKAKISCLSLKIDLEVLQN